MIIIDSREKKFNHIENYFKAHDIPYEVKKLDTGDYFNTDNPSVLVDRKRDLQEVCSNLSSGKENHTRFTNECRRAFSDHIRFIVLIEGTNCRELNDIKEWKSKYSKHTGRWLLGEMFRLTMAYKVEWQLCKKNETARKILEVLGYDNGRDQTEHNNEGTTRPIRNQSAE